MSITTYEYYSRSTTKVLEWSDSSSSIRFVQRWTSPNRSEFVNLDMRSTVGSLTFPPKFGPRVRGFGLEHLFFEVSPPKDSAAPTKASSASPQTPFLVHYPACRGGNVGTFLVNSVALGTPEMRFTYAYGSPYESFVSYKVSIMLGNNCPWNVGIVKFTRDGSQPLGFTLSLDSGVSFEGLAVIFLTAVAISKSGAFSEEFNDPALVSA